MTLRAISRSKWAGLGQNRSIRAGRTFLWRPESKTWEEVTVEAEPEHISVGDAWIRDRFGS